MRKRILSLLVALGAAVVLLVVPVSFACADTISGEGFSFDEATGTLTVTTNEGTYAWYDELDGLGDVAGVDLVKTLVLEEGITSIEDGAFAECSSITGTLSIPKSVTSIGEDAFFGCEGIRSLDLPSANKLTLGDSAFEGCTGIAGSLSLTENIDLSAERVFSGCTGITELILPVEGSLVIGRDAFSGCAGMTGTLVIPKSVTSLGWSAFSGCTGITSLDFSAEGPLTISGYAFWECSGLSGSIVIPASVSAIGDAAFKLCAGIDEMIFKGDAMFLEFRVFQDCSPNFTLRYPQGNSTWNGFSHEGINVETWSPADPLLSAGVVQRTSATTALLTFTSDKAGVCYTGLDYSVGAIVGKGAPCSAGVNTISLTDLTATTEKVFVRVKTADGALSSNAFALEVPADIAIYALAALPTSLDFGSVATGYTTVPPEQMVTVTNTGTQPITLLQPSSSVYEVGLLSSEDLKPNEAAHFTVQPKSGLVAGDYRETVTISETSGSEATIDVCFKVTAAAPGNPPSGESEKVTPEPAALARTGDAGLVGLPVGFLAVALCSVAVVLVVRRKTSRQ